MRSITTGKTDHPIQLHINFAVCQLLLPNTSDNKSINKKACYL